MSTLPAALPEEPTPAPSINWPALPEDTRRWALEQAFALTGCMAGAAGVAEAIATALIHGAQPPAPDEWEAPAPQRTGTIADQVADWKAHRGLT